MKIIIYGFRNIEHLEYDLKDKKHNFLFGLSGSGKSSISDSLRRSENNPLDITFGKTIKQSVSIDGKDPHSFRIECFDANTKERYFSEDRNSELTLFLFEESNSLKKTRASFIKLVQGFVEKLDLLSPKFLELQEVLQKAKADKLAKGGSALRATAITNKIISELKSIGDSPALKRILKIESTRYKWIKEGIAFYDEDADRSCPFCRNTIRNKKSLQRIEDIRKYDQKVVGEYKDSQESLEKAMHFSIDESIESFERVNQKLVEINHAVSEFDRYRSFLDKLISIEFFDREIPIYQSQYLKEANVYFRGFGKNISKLNDQINRINRQYKAVKKQTEEVLKNKSSLINHHLELLSIPYLLKARYVSKDNNQYYFFHKDNPASLNDPSNEDNYVCMSEGEKTILSLLLFIEQCRHDQPDLIIFDDPVSSFDEYRRTLLLKIMQKRLFGKTVLVLSHDHIFAKYALLEKYACRGCVDYLDHFVSPMAVRNISVEDFVDYRGYVLSRVKDCSQYLLKVAYLRGLFESCHGNSVYGYLSAILHASTKEKVVSELKKRNTTEEVVIERIKRQTGIRLENYEESNVVDVCFDGLDFYEKCLLARPFAEEGQVFNGALSDVYGELSDFIHVNQTLMIGLDPSKYPFCSRKLHTIVDAVASGTLVGFEVKRSYGYLGLDCS